MPGDKLIVFGGFGMVPKPEDDQNNDAEGMGALFFSWHNDTHILHTAGAAVYHLLTMSAASSVQGKCSDGNASLLREQYLLHVPP